MNKSEALRIFTHMGCRTLANNFFASSLKVVHKRKDFFLSEGQEKKQGSPFFCLSKYNYKYQGQERQDELNLNWDSFKWRNYDYAIGRFMSVDPLAEKYSYQSPYNFSENRVVDGIELEGLEFLDADDARVEIRRGGGVHLKMSSMTRYTKNKFQESNMNPANWSSGNVGVSTKIGELNLSSFLPSMDLPRGKREQGIKIQPPIAKTTGKPDRRFKKRFIGTGQMSNSSAKGLLAVEVVRLTGHALVRALVEYDQMKVDKHLEVLNEDVYSVMSQAAADGYLNDYNQNDILNITNVVLQGEMMLGEDLDQELYDLGIHLYNYYSNETYRETINMIDMLRKQLKKEMKIQTKKDD